jgi:hypothetical protein
VYWLRNIFNLILLCETSVLGLINSQENATIIRNVVTIYQKKGRKISEHFTVICSTFILATHASWEKVLQQLWVTAPTATRDSELSDPSSNNVTIGVQSPCYGLFTVSRDLFDMWSGKKFLKNVWVWNNVTSRLWKCNTQVWSEGR